MQPETIPPGTDLTVQVTLLADSQGVQGGHFQPIIHAKGITAPDSAWRELGFPLGEASSAGNIAVNLAPNERTTITLVFPLSTWGVADGEMVGWNDHWPTQWWNSPQTRVLMDAPTAPPPPPTTPTPTPSPVPAPQSSDSFFVSANLPAKFWGGVGYSDFGSGAIRQAESELRARLAEAQAAGMSGPVRTWFAPGNGLVSPPTPPWQYESSATVAQTVSDLLWYADLLEEFGFQLLPTLYAMPGQYRPEHMPQINAILQGIAGRTWAVDIVNEPEWTVDPSSWRTVAQTLVDAVHNAGHRATVEHARLSDVSRWPDVGFDLRMVSSYPHLGAGNWVGSWSPPDVGVPMYVGEFWLGGSINLPWAGTLTPEQALSDIRDRGWSGVLLWPLLPGVTGETQADLAAVGRFTAGGTSSSSSGAAGSGGFRVANVVQPETIPPGTDLTVQVTLLADSQGVQGGHFLPIIWAKGITAPDSAWRELGSPLGEASGAGGIAVNLAPNERTTITLVFPLSTWGVADGEMVGWNDHWPNQWWNSPQTRIVQGRAP